MDDDDFVIIDDIGEILTEDIPPAPFTQQGPHKPKQSLNDSVTLFSGDCLETMRQFADNCMDAIVTDPPYELGFMGKKWDKKGIAFQIELWREVFRILKPGGHILVMGGTRTYHRLVCAIEDAGFEIRDTLMWITGQGFPKSQNISKMIDKAAGVEQKVIGISPRHGGGVNNVYAQDKWTQENINKPTFLTAPATPEAVQWTGWGTALKPAHEMICLARKPLSEKTVAANVLMWGTGGLNIEGCRVGETKRVPGSLSRASNGNSLSGSVDGSLRHETGDEGGHDPNIGRWPTNLLTDGSPEVVEVFPDNCQGGLSNGNAPKGEPSNGAVPSMRRGKLTSRNDFGSAARFFPVCEYTYEDFETDIPIKQWLLYCAKATKQDRNGSKHPTIKPIKLMQWLCRLITPPGGCLLDPFAGSGTTGAAAVREGFQAILCENDPEYQDDICRRFSPELLPADDGDGFIMVNTDIILDETVEEGESEDGGETQC